MSNLFDMFVGDDKEWKFERAVIPISTRNSSFNVETDVKWCPDTDEIHYRNPKRTASNKDWVRVTEHTDLYKRLLSNFKNKYVLKEHSNNKNRTEWIRKR